MRSSKNEMNLKFPKILKGVVCAFLFSMLLFLVLAMILYFTKIPESIIPKAVIIISAISILFGGIRVTKDVENMGWLHGGFVGFLYMCILIILSLLIVPTFSFGFKMVLDLFLGFLVGIIAGILGVNL